jgi:hypothetical protein
MDINRTGPRNGYLTNPAPAPENGARFTGAVSTPAAQPPPASNALPTVNRADLANPAKLEEAVTRGCSKLVDDATSRLGISMTDAQKKSLVDFLGSDPVIRGKLLNYYEKS